MQSREIDPITADVLRAAVHDLAGPANRLRLLSQLLREKGSTFDEDTRKLLGYVEEAGKAVGVVAGGIRSYVETCGRPLQCKPLDLNQSLEAAIVELQAEIDQAGARVMASPLPAVEGDGFLMTWVFQELLTNALRFRDGRPLEVRISCGRGGPADWFVSVADNGSGIEAGMAERVFRPFKKLAAGRGAGLGLTICRKIVELHEGKMWVEPRERGAEVRFFLGGVPPECL